MIVQITHHVHENFYGHVPLERTYFLRQALATSPIDGSHSYPLIYLMLSVDQVNIRC